MLVVQPGWSTVMVTSERFRMFGGHGWMSVTAVHRRSVVRGKYADYRARGLVFSVRRSVIVVQLWGQTVVDALLAYSLAKSKRRPTWRVHDVTFTPSMLIGRWPRQTGRHDPTRPFDWFSRQGWPDLLVCMTRERIIGSTDDGMGH